MFTGIVQEVGTIKQIKKKKDTFQIEISCKRILKRQKIGSSISINGCCLTIVKKTANYFMVEVTEETLKKTNLGDLQKDDKVNMEASLTLNSLMGGHLVLGHVDAVGRISKIDKLPKSHLVEIKFPQKFRRFLIHVGSISIDGVSMTVAKIKTNSFVVSVIPHTWKVTVFSRRKLNDRVNLEFDVIGKYVENIIKPGVN